MKTKIWHFLYFSLLLPLLNFWEELNDYPRCLRTGKLAVLLFMSAWLLTLFIALPVVLLFYLAAWLTLLYAGIEILETGQPLIVRRFLTLCTPIALAIFGASLLPPEIYNASGQVIFGLAGKLSGAFLLACSVYGWFFYWDLKKIKAPRKETEAPAILNELSYLASFALALIGLGVAGLLFSSALATDWQTKLTIISQVAIGLLVVGGFILGMAAIFFFALIVAIGCAKEDLGITKEKTDEFIMDCFSHTDNNYNSPYNWYL